MKNLVISLSLLAVLVVLGSFVFIDTAGAKTDLLADLLDLPAPPPPNPSFRPPGSEKPESFYSKKNPPSDDAPIDDLLSYWGIQSSGYNDLGYNIEPSPRTLERLMGAIEKDPKKLLELLNSFPENEDTASFVKRIYDSWNEGEDGEYPRDSIREWLKLHSSYYSDELAEVAATVADGDDYVNNQEELLALTRVDFSKAQPIVNRLYSDSSQPASQALARWALYKHAIATDSFGDIERYRDELKAIVENKSLAPGTRDLAMDALVKEKEWSGRDDWYMGLMDDETLADLKTGNRTFTGLTTIITTSPPEKYIDRMLAMLKSSNQTRRNAAIRNLGTLISKDYPEVVEALLPWLEDPKWAAENSGERMRLVDSLQTLAIPASVPGLVDILEEKSTPTVTRFSGSNTNSAPASVPPPDYENTPQFLYRNSAIYALATQKDSRSVSALRRVINEVDEYERSGVVRAIFYSNGFSIPEQVDALVRNARDAVNSTPYNGPTSNAASTSVNARPAPPPTVTTVETTAPISYSGNFANTAAGPPAPKKPVTGDEIAGMLGGILSLDGFEAGEPLVTAVVDRAASLEKREPQTAEALRKVLRTWTGPAINAMLLSDVRTGRANVDTVVKLLSLRKELVEKQSSAVYEIRDGGPVASGIAACILNDNGQYDAILGGGTPEAKAALLACARLIRADLPVRKVAESLASDNRTLATAAELYLESNDSPEARGIVLARHPNEARIMGATTHFAPAGERIVDSEFTPALFQSVDGSVPLYPYYTTPDFAADLKATEKKLQKEVKESPDLMGVYAYDGNFIRIYKDRAVLSWEDDPARYFERPLSSEEFNSFKSFLASNSVDQLTPFITEPTEHEEDSPKELLMLGRQGGRRVFIRSWEVPVFFKELDSTFEALRKPQAKLHYWLEKEVPGLEILFSDPHLNAQAVWKTGPDLRIVIEDTERAEQIEKELQKAEEQETSREDYDYEKGAKLAQQRRTARLYEHISWRKLDSEGKPNEIGAQPQGFYVIPPQDGRDIRAGVDMWRTQAAGTEIRADVEAIYKIKGGQMTTLKEGYYSQPLITSNGKWIIASKYADGAGLVRINVLTGKEFSSGTPLYAVANVPAVGRVLVGSVGPYGESDVEDYSFYLLDAETGVMQAAKGEFRPFAQQTFRQLQPTGTPDEFWAAIPNKAKTETVIGRYNAKTFTFTPTQKVPKIGFSSMDMWVDDKIYITYTGHLIAIPLKKP